MNADGKEPYELFLQMEKEYDLFKLRTIDGLPAWDIIRVGVWMKIIMPKHQFNPQISFNLSRISIPIKSFVSFLKLPFYKAENFFYGYSRIANCNGEYYDPYFDSIKNLVKEDFIFYEAMLGKNNYTKENRVFDIFPYFNQIAKLMRGFVSIKKKINKEDLTKIYNAIIHTFGSGVINYIGIQRILDDFYSELHFYSWLFKFKKIKRVFFYGYRKGLCTAARKRNISLFEFQHGHISDSTIGYNYGHPVLGLTSSDVIMPDILFTFSDIWTQNKYIPVKCIEVGTNFFNIDIVPPSKEINTIVVVSLPAHNEYLEKLTRSIALHDRNIKIYYKLHPMQAVIYDEQKSYFSDVTNVQVVPLDKNINDMLSMADEFIAIYSTAIFEILQAGKSVYIYKQGDYKNLKSYFNLSGVYLFDEVDEFLRLRKNSNNSVGRKALQFFKPFNAKAFLDAIELPKVG